MKQGKDKPSTRAQRLAAALRENLKRRKAQARGRDSAPREEAAEHGDPGAKGVKDCD
jgi:hypothetical protein